MASAAKTSSHSYTSVDAEDGWELEDSKPQPNNGLISEHPGSAPVPSTVGGQPDPHPQPSAKFQSSREHESEGWDFDDQDEDNGIGGAVSQLDPKAKSWVTALPPESSWNRDVDTDVSANDNGWDFEDDLT